MTLDRLLRGIPVLDAKADMTTSVTSIACDSRRVRPGTLFAAISGYETDGNAYIADAIQHGAAAVVTACRPTQNIPYILVENDRRALAMLSCNFYGHPSEAMALVGVTGTNGKTSVTMLLKQVLENTIQAKVGLIGTVCNMIGDEVYPALRTTPDSLELQQLLCQMRSKGCTHVVMEVSSHALALERIAGIHFRVGVFTNLSEDHLDFHNSMDSYFRTKACLFAHCDRAVLNGDDAWVRRLIGRIRCPALTFSTQDRTDLQGEAITLRSDGVSYRLQWDGNCALVTVPIPGIFTVHNSMAVIGAAACLGISPKRAAMALEKGKGIPGRVEVVPTPGKPYTVLIDYAHTPDGLEKLLMSVRQFCRGSLILVFGCGGNRDRAKRPMMGRVAASLADYVILTSDNPRWENPEDILSDILSGVPDGAENCIVIENRQKAIRNALDIGKKHDIIILAGKGHETFQEIRGVKYPLDDREEVNAYLRETEDS